MLLRLRASFARVYWLEAGVGGMILKRSVLAFLFVLSFLCVSWKPNGPLKKALRNILVERVSTLAKKHAENVIALVQVNAADETELRRLSQEWIKFASESDNRARRLKKGDKQSFAVMAAMVPMALEDILN